MDPRHKRQARRRRHVRARARLRGTPERPRLSVYRSNAAIYAQVIDDLAGHTMVAASSLDEGVATDAGPEGGKTALAHAVGRLVAERARERGVEVVVFDRGGNRYHGRVRALAEGAREAGLRL
ncbi:MAG: 50S ribosomal protein L18 [Actinobacteria bacterium]|nr:50S ribosomal protein L18 [Actinomycetota bacterium]